jgi:hypothetical protein
MTGNLLCMLGSSLVQIDRFVALKNGLLCELRDAVESMSTRVAGTRLDHDV